MMEIQSKEQLQSVLRSYPIVIVDMYADWCAPCKHFSPKYAMIAEKFKNSNVLFCKENADLDINTVTGLPSILFFVKGRKIHSILGGDDAEVVLKLKEIYENFGYPLPSEKEEKDPSATGRGLPMGVSNSVVAHKVKGDSYARFSDLDPNITPHIGSLQRFEGYLPQKNSVRQTDRRPI